MHSWSSSYSYSNNGKNENISYQNSYTDKQNKYSTGIQRNRDLHTNDKNESFYKIKKNENQEKSIIGKSHNQSFWNIEKKINHSTKMKETLGYDQYGGYFKYIDNLGRPKFSQTKLDLNRNIRKITKHNNSVIQPVQKVSTPYSINNAFNESFFSGF